MAARLCQTCDFSRGYGGNCNEKYMPGDGLYGEGLFHEPECKYYVPADFIFVERALKRCECENCTCKMSEADNRVYEE